MTAGELTVGSVRRRRTPREISTDGTGAIAERECPTVRSLSLAIRRNSTTLHVGKVTNMAFRFDRLTLKSQEAVQAAQSLARERGHQRLEPMHLLSALLDPEQQVIRALLEQLGVNPAQVKKAADEGLNALPRVTGGEQTLGPDLASVLDARPGRGRPDERPVRLGRAPPARPGEGQEPGAAAPRRPGHQREGDPPLAPESPRRPDRDRPEPRRQVPGARAVRPRPGRAGPQGQDGPGHRPRLRDPPRGPGALPPDQEQPGPDRRARRGQDRDRRGPGPADRLRRRPRDACRTAS